MVESSLHFRRVFGIIAIGYLIVAIFQLSKTQGFEFTLYVTEIAVALSVITISVLYWTFKPDLEKFGIAVTERDKQYDRNLEEKRQQQAKDHRKKINEEFLRRRQQLGVNVWTWFETFQSFADAKQYLQHICTGHPELYEKMKSLMAVEKELKSIPKPIPESMKEKARELKKQEEELREKVRQEFDDLQTKIRQEVEDVDGLCDNCVKFYRKKDKGFKEMKSKLDSKQCSCGKE
jgi:hypothetical protein